MSSILMSGTNVPCFVYENECPSGLVKIAEKVKKDVELVFGKMPDTKKSADAELPEGGLRLVFGIAGQSPLIDKLAEEGVIDISAIAGKREVYGFFPAKEDLLVIAGSDKRGTIYGLFHLSELMGVSPFVNWSDLKPAKKDSLNIDEIYISKEPSVVYRGFFINDEWPAFGNWCMRHFGGVNAKMYEGVFELLLRLKGNYLWPAMWASCFAEDGPGLESAELADELGVVMGLSHHEPCLRHGEEYSHVRGKDSIYGDAWSFISNKEGITRFWRDGLKRNGHLENVITVGMRGERDSTILGANATLKDNIDLLRDVLKTQEQLIKEEVNEDLTKVPRMLALYKEVEAYYYGDEKTPGLKEGCDELEDVILMLCDDNHGYLRSLPDEKMRRHPGGFGMYYHFDYHGGPISYEWINSTYLPVVWQQMSTAYEYGIQKLWIVNVGDLGLQEMPLSYFLDLAYDFDKWGRCGKESAYRYMEYWMEKNFGHAFSAEEIKELADIQMQGSRLIHNRRPEHLREGVYHPQADHEAGRMLRELEDLTARYEKIESSCTAECADALYELIGYSLLGGLNLIKMWIMRGFNHYYASVGSVAANDYAQKIKDAMKTDSDLKDRFDSAADRKWDGFAEAMHIGFKNWNSEECANPVIETVIPVKGKTLVAGTTGETGASRGLEWTKRILPVNVYDKEDDKTASTQIFVSLCGDEDVDYEVSSENCWIRIGKDKGTLTKADPIQFIDITVEKEAANGSSGQLFVKYPGGCVEFKVNAPAAGGSHGDSFEERNGFVVMDAAHFIGKHDTEDAAFTVLPGLGRREDAIALMPAKAYFEDPAKAPYVDYSFVIKEDGDFDIGFQLLCCNPWIQGRKVKFCYSLSDGKVNRVDAVSDTYVAGETADWGFGVLNHVHIITAQASLKAGYNTLRIYGTDPENIPERIILVRKGTKAPVSFFGPDESRRV
ncbi:MAG: glycosyl hydrolase 115 family protein [Lachnospiraceae bacterium]|nr:glycosyl hydrolase 115 family protein [Lachnospiraceae bacterium]